MFDDAAASTNMSHMFSKATVFNGNISAWDVNRQITDIQYMFENAEAFDYDITSWNVTHLDQTKTTMMFSGALGFLDTA